MIIAATVLCLVLISGMFASGLLAKYTTGDKNGDSARVAKFSAYEYNESLKIQVMKDSRYYDSFTPVTIGEGGSATVEVEANPDGVRKFILKLFEVGSDGVVNYDVPFNETGWTAVSGKPGEYIYTVAKNTAKTLNVTVPGGARGTLSETEETLRYVFKVVSRAEVDTKDGIMLDFGQDVSEYVDESTLKVDGVAYTSRVKESGKYIFSNLTEYQANSTAYKAADHDSATDDTDWHTLTFKFTKKVYDSSYGYSSSDRLKIGKTSTIVIPKAEYDRSVTVRFADRAYDNDLGLSEEFRRKYSFEPLTDESGVDSVRGAYKFMLTTKSGAISIPLPSAADYVLEGPGGAVSSGAGVTSVSASAAGEYVLYLINERVADPDDPDDPLHYPPFDGDQADIFAKFDAKNWTSLGNGIYTFEVAKDKDIEIEVPFGVIEDTVTFDNKSDPAFAYVRPDSSSVMINLDEARLKNGKYDGVANVTVMRQPVYRVYGDGSPLSPIGILDDSKKGVVATYLINDRIFIVDLPENTKYRYTILESDGQTEVYSKSGEGRIFLKEEWNVDNSGTDFLAAVAGLDSSKTITDYVDRFMNWGTGRFSFSLPAGGSVVLPVPSGYYHYCRESVDVDGGTKFKIENNTSLSREYNLYIGKPRQIRLEVDYDVPVPGCSLSAGTLDTATDETNGLYVFKPDTKNFSLNLPSEPYQIYNDAYGDPAHTYIKYAYSYKYTRNTADATKQVTGKAMLYGAFDKLSGGLDYNNNVISIAKGSLPFVVTVKVTQVD